MAAPTPISSLVHSSTLVTAGLWLIVRNYSYFISVPALSEGILVLGLFTSLYAGLRALTEPDLKKVIALSTLSHLGFILFSLGVGLPSLAFFHLIAHALFKSTLFIATGYYITLLNHYQDSRYLSSLASASPFFRAVILISETSLLGLPFASGYFRKDYILEAYTNITTRRWLFLVVFLNLILTYSYGLRLIRSLFGVNRMGAYSLVRYPPAIFLVLLTGLSLASLVLGLLLSSLLLVPTFFVSTAIKITPPALLILRYVVYLIFSSAAFALTQHFPVLIHYFGSRLVFLAPLWSNTTSRLYSFLSFCYSREIEHNWV
jgi:NADH-ubiquinone oxidoreductase chain 5